MDLREHIRAIPDWPKPGIVFRDLTPLFLSPGALRYTIDRLADYARKRRVEYVVAAEARGFVLGGAIAERVGAGFIPIRKPGKLPFETASIEYALEYGTDSLEMHVDAVSGGSRVLIHDDLLATGGTARACVDLVQQHGGVVAGCAFIVELGFLPGRKRLTGHDIHSLVVYDSE